MLISECIESLNLFISHVDDRLQGERDKITKLHDIKPSSFEFVLFETIELLEQADEEKAYQAINDIPAVNRWIPCSERLPKYGLDVLVYTKSWEEHIQVAHIQYDGIMWELSDGEFYFSQSEVSHWMPLPGPPEKELR